MKGACLEMLRKIAKKVSSISAGPRYLEGMVRREGSGARKQDLASFCAMVTASERI